MEFPAFFQHVYFDNSVLDYIVFALILLLGHLLRGFFTGFISRFFYSVLNAQAYKLTKQQFSQQLRPPLNTVVFLCVLYVALQQLKYPLSWALKPADEFGLRMIAEKLFLLVLAIAVFRVILRFVHIVGEILVQRAAATDNKMDDQIVPFAIEIIKVLVVVLGGLTIMSSVFDVNVTALATGLGIGGIAIAMASKESLENLLGSFTIFLDKPFTYGDIVTVNGYTGTVEKVGFRSTRIRTFDKSVVTVPNKNMVNAELDNLGVRPIRRVRFDIGLTYGTSVDQIKAIVDEVEALINAHPHTTADDARVRFAQFGASSLDIMVVYFVDSPSWDLLIDTKQTINYQIMEVIQKHGSDFAFPTTTVHLEK